MTINGANFSITPATLCNNGSVEKYFTGGAPSGWSLGAISSNSLDRLLIDNFEYNTIPDSFNDGVNPYPLWSFLDASNVPPGTTAVSNTEALFGTRSLQITSEGGSYAIPMQGFFNNNFGTGGVNDWNYIREFLGYTELQKYNRLRFWMKLPSVHTHRNDGYNNLHVGTYLRNTSAPRTGNESDNAHYYHYFDAGYSGGWQQFIVDPHVHHQRNVNQEHGVLPDGHLEAGYNYFDLMTYFYWEYQGAQLAGSTDWFVDGVELYEETYDEDLDNIYAINAYKSEITPNEIAVRWSRNRNDISQTYDVKYAFTSFYDNGGWSHGTAAPSGTGITSITTHPMDGGYTQVVWSTDQIDFSGQDIVYIAIKHETEETRFRQVAIPVTSAGFNIVGGL